MNPLSKLFLIALFIPFLSVAQVQDTLQYAREKAYGKEFSEANRILTIYNTQERDIYGLWLQAQVAHWMGDFNKSRDFYARALILSPELPGLKLDFGRTLFNSGELKDSEEVLLSYLSMDAENPDALIMLAYLDYWKGFNQKAKNTAEQVISSNPEHKMALDLLNEIKVATAPYITIISTFGSDDQPLDFNEYIFTIGKYHSRFLSPTLKAGYRDFTLPNTNVQSYFAEAGNTMSFGMSGPLIKLTAGIFKPDSNKDLTALTGMIGISQSLAKNLSLELNTARIPYQYTLSSLRMPLMQQVSSIAITLNDPEFLIGKAAYERQTFPDENSINTAYAYLLKSLFNSTIFRLDLGYSFSYAHSDKNTFIVDEVMLFRPGPNNGNQLKGIYDPYFSPQNQMINSALGSVKIIPAQAFEINLRTSYGFYAQAENTVLLESSGLGNTPSVNTYYYTQTYTPVEIVAGIATRISTQFHVKAEYQYSKLFYYEFHRIGFSAKYNFFRNN